MPIKIDWRTDNFNSEKQNIYRSNTPIDITNLPTPIADVANNIVTYTDNTVEQGKMYYYAIGAVVGNDVAISRRLAIAYRLDTGPGPANIIRGDWDYGYFGSMPIGELVDNTTFKSLIGYTTATVGPATTLHKFAIKGKIYYVPNNNQILTTSWQGLYNLGLVYGDLPVQPHVLTRFGDVPQNKIITIGSYNYRIRLPASRVDYMDSDNPVQTGGEIEAMCSAVRIYRSLPNLKYLGVDDDNSDVRNTLNLTMDFTNSTPTAAVITRGGGAASPLWYVCDMVNSIPATNTAATYGAKFIMELIP